MLKHKRSRERGKLSLRKYFQELKEGERVAIKRNLSYSANFPSRLQGRTGAVVSKRGKAFVINIRDGKKEKQFIVKRVHIKKLESSKNKDKSIKKQEKKQKNDKK